MESDASWASLGVGRSLTSRRLGFEDPELQGPTFPHREDLGACQTANPIVAGLLLVPGGR
jgi:hypothetical protein